MIVYRELSSLERDLGFSAQTLYAVSNHLGKHYHTVELPKRSGGLRKLSIPDPLLKAIQRKITDTLLAHMPVSRYAAAYSYGSSTMRNAKPHIAKRIVLKLDILHFFDSIRYISVKNAAFPPEIYSEPLRILLAMLCYRKDALPQGAPSSPAITNIIMHPFDERIGQWCRKRGIAYSRYCDDMTFSGDFAPSEVIRFIRLELKKMGFLLNEQKTRIQRPGQRQSVTGIVVNEKISIPRDYRRNLRQELYYCRKFGVQDHLHHLGLEISADTYRMKLLGKVNYVLQAHPDDPQMLEAKRMLLASSTTALSIKRKKEP